MSDNNKVGHSLTGCRVHECKMFIATCKKWAIWEPLPRYVSIPGYIKGTAELNKKAFDYAIHKENLPIKVYNCCGTLIFIRTDMEEPYYG